MIGEEIGLRVSHSWVAYLAESELKCCTLLTSKLSSSFEGEAAVDCLRGLRALEE